jgi:hypothetical protein
MATMDERMQVRLVQLKHGDQRHVAMVVDDSTLALIEGVDSAYRLAVESVRAGLGLKDQVKARAGGRRLDYAPIARGEGPWKLLPAWDHPDESSRCLVTGTGLTHRTSAANRQAMHASPASHQEPTDSMKIYEMGLAGGRPARGEVGVAPEWFYKGTGAILRAGGEPLDVPNFALGGGEEAEIAGCYLIDDRGQPRRVGLATANEFSDHVTERVNYLYLAPSKLRCCALGPELVLDAPFEDVRGQVRIRRGHDIIWSTTVATGEANMCHSLANLEHHHFKYPQHRRAGDAHVHFLGADSFSSAAGIEMKDGDEMIIQWGGFGLPLVNPLRVDRSGHRLVEIQSA